jgi:hypothetical protein
VKNGRVLTVLTRLRSHDSLRVYYCGRVRCNGD